MKRKWLNKLAVYSVSLGLMLTNYPTYAATTLTWSSVNQYVKENGADVTIDLTTLDTAGAPISVPSSVNSITVIGDPAKSYNNMSINVEGRSTYLTVTLKNVNAKSDKSVLNVSGNTNTTSVKFEGTNSLISTGGNGIAVYTGSRVEISGVNSGNTDQLTIRAGGHAAGIGGNFDTVSTPAIKKGNGTIIINSGTIDVQGGAESAGIGGAPDAETAYEDITINGGNVKATGGSNGAAGIGSPYKQSKDCGKITITGGNIEAYGTQGGAGIGGGLQHNNGKVYDIEIKGSKDTTKVKAVGTAGGAGIGGGCKGHAADIKVYGGTIIAEGSTDSEGAGGAAIGGGSQRGFNVLEIGENSVKDDNPYISQAIAGAGAAAIGTGGRGSGTGLEVIKLKSGVIDKLETTGGAAGIGGGVERGFEKITVGYTRLNEVKSGDGGAAIGTGRLGSAGSGHNKIVIEAGSSSYVAPGDYDGRKISSAGGGYNRETGHSAMEIAGTLFSTNNKFGGDVTLAPGMQNYAFECYTVTGVDPGTGTNIRALLTSGDFVIKHKNDPNIKHTPTTDSNGRIFSIMPSLGTSKLRAGSGYYCERTIGGITYYASEFERTDEPGAGINGTNVVVIKMEFIQGKTSTSVADLGEPKGSKFVPYSYANIDIETTIEQHMSDGKSDKISDAKVVVDLKQDPTDLINVDLSDLNKIAFKVSNWDSATSKFVEDNALTATLNSVKSTNVSIVGDKITIKYPTSMMPEGEQPAALTFKHKITILVPCTLKQTVEIKSYYDDHVEKPTELENSKKIEGKFSYMVAACTMIDGEAIYEDPKPVEANKEYYVRYWYIPNVK